jgi:glycosyltransferase involved in cell wall biosynthesis
MEHLAPQACTLTVAGARWWDEAELQAALARLARHRISFLGRVENTCLRPVIHSHDVVVIPSHYEHFGNVSLEAQAAGRPVIAAATGGLADTVADGESGYLFKPRDPTALANTIAQFARDPERALDMGSFAAARVRELYAWPSVVERLDTLFSAIAAGDVPNDFSNM